MAARLVPIDRDTPLLLPPDRRDWAPADHLVHFVLDAVDALDPRQVRVNTRGTGREQYPPSTLLARLIYSYATGTVGRRRLEQNTYDSVPVRRLTVAADGTKVLAHASQHSAVSYARAGEMIEQLELEVRQLLAKAEQADATPLPDGLTIPGEITRRQERQAALAQARAEIAARAQARYAVQLAEHQVKLAERAAKKERGERVGGQPPQAPNPTRRIKPTSPMRKAGS